MSLMGLTCSIAYGLIGGIGTFNVLHFRGWAKERSLQEIKSYKSVSGSDDVVYKY